MILQIIEKVYNDRVASGHGSNRDIQLSKTFMAQAMKEISAVGMPYHGKGFLIQPEFFYKVNGTNVRVTNRELRHNSNEKEVEDEIVRLLSTLE